MSRLATALCLTTSVCLPQSPSTDPFLAWLDRIAQRQLDDRERAIAAIRTKADADRRKTMVRTKLTELIGGLPTYSGPLNPRVTGRLQSDTQTIEKVTIRSHSSYTNVPGFFQSSCRISMPTWRHTGLRDVPHWGACLLKKRR